MALVNLQPAYEKAKEEFAHSNPAFMAVRTGFAFERYANQYTISFLGQQYLVNHPSGEIIAQDGEPIPLENSICILHYLVNATDDEIAGSFITFRELPSGFIYEIPFTNRCIRPLLGNFGSCPQKMVEAGLRLGGTAAKLGDYAVMIPVFPKIPITFVIWEGDEEFPVNANILFDRTASKHLATEDFALLPSLVISAMKKLKENS